MGPLPSSVRDASRMSFVCAVPVGNITSETVPALAAQLNLWGTTIEGII